MRGLLAESSQSLRQRGMAPGLLPWVGPCASIAWHRVSCRGWGPLPQALVGAPPLTRTVHKLAAQGSSGRAGGSMQWYAQSQLTVGKYISCVRG